MPRPLRVTPIDRLVARTLKEIADELGCTLMAVYYIEQKALKKLRAELVARRIVTREGRYSTL